jgi:hypothetical protein
MNNLDFELFIEIGHFSTFLFLFYLSKIQGLRAHFHKQKNDYFV